MKLELPFSPLIKAAQPKPQIQFPLNTNVFGIKRILIFLIFVGIFTASYAVGAKTPVSDKDALDFLEEFNSTVEGIDPFGIFANNASVGLPMFIPGFGIAWGMYTGGSTGIAFSALSTTIPELQNISALAILYSSPFGLMELGAYSLGMSRSFLLIHSIIKKISIKAQLRPTAIEIGIAIGLLLAGGFIEHSMMG